MRIAIAAPAQWSVPGLLAPLVFCLYTDGGAGTPRTEGRSRLASAEAAVVDKRATEGMGPRSAGRHSLETSAHSRLVEGYGKLPVHFEANRGQTNPSVKFVARAGGSTLLLTASDAVLLLTGPEARGRGEAPGLAGQQPRRQAKQAALRLTVLDSNPAARVSGDQEKAGKANYFVGNDPARWRTNVPTYERVRYDEIYRGIDLVYYGDQRQLEYDFVVKPGADPKRITLRFQGADSLEMDDAGDLLLHTPAGSIRQRKPVIYQEVQGIRRAIAGGYVLKGPLQVGFKVAAFDRTRPLVIDPVLVYSTYLGGSGMEWGTAIAVDGAGSAYVTGRTLSANFPATPGAFDVSFNGNSDAFVTKLDPTGTALVYSTYLGGSDWDEAHLQIAVDGAGSAYVAGGTWSPDFPTTPGAFDTTFDGPSDVFVTKLSPSGSALVYSTYLGGTGGEDGFAAAITVDGAGNAYVTGRIQSADFPTTLGAFDPTFNGGGCDVVVTKLNPTGSALIYSTYLGGSGCDQGYGIAVDGTGSAYVTGFVDSAGFPTTAGAFQTAFNGGSYDSFVAKLNPTGSALVYATYVGGSGSDQSLGLTVDGAGSAYLTGGTSSADFPTTPGAFDTTLSGPEDAFVTKLDPTGSGLVYSTYLGGSGHEFGGAVARDGAGNAYVTGRTNSADFPTTADAFDTTLNGGDDVFVARLNPTGSALVYSSYVGGGGFDVSLGIAVDGSGNAYVTGRVQSADFPTTAGGFDTTFNGGDDAFVLKLSLASLPPVANAGADQSIHAGQVVDLDGSGSFDDNTPTEDLGFAWTLTETPEGSAATLTDADTVTPSFLADVAGDYVVSLTVTDTDGLSSVPDSVLVSSLNAAPIADAGPDQGTFVGNQVTLNGSASQDPDGDALSFSWALVAPPGSLATLSGADSAFPTLAPDVPGAYTAVLTVADGFGGLTSDAATVSVVTAEQFAETQAAGALNEVAALPPSSVTTQGNQKALQNFLTQAIAALQAGDVTEGRLKLTQALERTDGCPLREAPDGNGPGRDWVTDCAAQRQLYEQLRRALDALDP